MEEDRGRQVGADADSREIIFSQAVKAGKRIYYVDVKKNRRGDMFISLTESKKVVGPTDQATFEKHKIFIYQEDFGKFLTALNRAVAFVDGTAPSNEDSLKEETKTGEGLAEGLTGSLEDDIEPLGEKELSIDIDF